MDASSAAAALIDTGHDGKRAESAVADPDRVLVESTNILRRLERAEIVFRIEANGARVDLLGTYIELSPFAPFARQIRELRGNLTSHDAW